MLFQQGVVRTKLRYLRWYKPHSMTDYRANNHHLKPKTNKLVFAVSLLSTQHYGVRAKTGHLGIRIICPSGVAYRPAECCITCIEWSGVSSRGMLYYWVSTIKIQLIVLSYRKSDVISSKCSMFLPWYQ